MDVILSNLCPTFDQFSAEYAALTGHPAACRWQYRLFQRFLARKLPRDIELATGIGKTSVAAIWLLAFAHSRKLSVRLPRRLVFVVDRRVVVDQASEFVDCMRRRLEEAETESNSPLTEVAKNLRAAGCGHAILETSTLRGQRTLDLRWRSDPSQPAILIGTVDMIGSRLFFSGYGRLGPWSKPYEAGLLGRDSLVLLDEAHLCPAFAATLAAIEDRRDTDSVGVIRMGATLMQVSEMLGRTPGLDAVSSSASQIVEGEGEVFQLLDDEVSNDVIVHERLNAAKRGSCVEESSSPAEEMVGWAMNQIKQEPNATVGLIFNTVKEAREGIKRLRSQLADGDASTSDVDLVSITGSMRGWDRDITVNSDGYGRFRSQRDRSIKHDRPAFLVATSCIEVGADIDCDHLATEACPVDNLIQRLGRVNRIGFRKDSPSRVLVVGKVEETPAGQVFLKLRRLEAAIHRLQRRSDADHSSGVSFTSSALLSRLTRHLKSSRNLFETHVPPPALTESVLDDFSMTSKYPLQAGRPKVGLWLHGSGEEASLYLEIAWRLELDKSLDSAEAVRLLEAFPISPRESARCSLHEAVDVIAAICNRNPDDTRCVVLCRNGEYEAHSLSTLSTDKDELRALLSDSLVVLPTFVGGYDGRFVDAAAKTSVADIAEEDGVQSPIRPKRRRIWLESGCLFPETELSQQVGENHEDFDAIDDECTEEELLRLCAGPVRKMIGNEWRLVEAVGSGQRAILVAQSKRLPDDDGTEGSASVCYPMAQPLIDHLQSARDAMQRLCEKLNMPAELRPPLIVAAASHDLGKDRPWWQRAVGNTASTPVAKSSEPFFKHSINQGYRHELGSVTDTMATQEFASLNEDQQELCLHLIAAHHGHARPGFRKEAAGPISSEAIHHAIEEAAHRFFRLQSRYGRWMLAWLEALVKASDGMASQIDEASE